MGKFRIKELRETGRRGRQLKGFLQKHSPTSANVGLTLWLRLKLELQYCIPTPTAEDIAKSATLVTLVYSFYKTSRHAYNFGNVSRILQTIDQGYAFC